MSLNRVILAGIVSEEPEFVFDAVYNNALEIKLKINRADIFKVEYITVLIFNEELINRALAEVHIGKFMMITNAKIVTKNYTRTKTIVCPHCQEVEYRQEASERTDVECMDYALSEIEDQDAPVGLNKVFLYGNICSDIERSENLRSGIVYAKYKLAVNRFAKSPNHNYKFINKEVLDTPVADYPFITTFGPAGEKVYKNLNKTALIAVEGAIQERTVIQKIDEFPCPQCGNFINASFSHPVREVVTSKVHYITFGRKDHPRQIGETDSFEDDLVSPTSSVASMDEKSSTSFSTHRIDNSSDEFLKYGFFDNTL